MQNMILVEHRNIFKELHFYIMHRISQKLSIDVCGTDD